MAAKAVDVVEKGEGKSSDDGSDTLKDAGFPAEGAVPSSALPSIKSRRTAVNDLANFGERLALACVLCFVCILGAACTMMRAHACR